jgi:glutathione S-transferase
MSDDDLPTLFVCHGDDEGPKFHPCKKVQEALREANIPYNKVIAGHGHPLPFLRKGSRQVVVDATGSDKLPTLRLSDGTVVIHSKAILEWVSRRR